MSTIVLRPSVSLSIGSWPAATATGGTVSAVLADDTDTTYLTFDAAGESAFLRFPNPTIPAGGLFKTVAVRLRSARIGTPSPNASTYLRTDEGLAGPGHVFDNRYFTWSLSTTVTILSDVDDVGDVLDDLTVLVRQATSGNLRMFAMYLDVVYVEKPTTTVDAPTGTLTDTNAPLVEWTRDFDLDGGPGYQWVAKIFSQAQYEAVGFDPDTSAAVESSGTVAGGGAAWQSSAALADGNYRAYVKWWQRVNDQNHVADWAFSAFTVDVDSPDAPSLVLTSQPSDGRIRLDLTDNGGAATTDLYEIERSTDDGVTFETLRTVEGSGLVTADASDDAVAFDYEAPNGVETTYRIRALHDYGSSLYGASEWTEAAETWESTSWWLKHPTDPTLNAEVVKVRSLGGYNRPARRAVHHPVGAVHPVVISDTPGPKQGQIVLRLDTQAEQDAVAALFADAVVVLVQAPPDTHGWEDRWCSFDSHELAKVIDHSWDSHTFDTLPWIEVGAPTGNLESWL